MNAIRHCVATINETVIFVTGSASRRAILSKICGDGNLTLKKMCETRWVERHDCVLRFTSMFENVLDSLATISTLRDLAASSKAKTLLNTLQNSEFLVSLAVLNKTLALTINVSK